MGLTYPKFISIDEASRILKASKEIIVHNVLSGGLPVYAYGVSVFKIQSDNGAEIIEYSPEGGQEPDRLTNPRLHYRNPEYDAVILATYPTVVHMGLNGDSNHDREVPAAEYPFDIDNLYFLTADVLAVPVLKLDESASGESETIATSGVEVISPGGRADTPEDIATQLRNEGEPNHAIAVRLKELFFPQYRQHELMRAIDPKYVEQWDASNADPNKATTGRPKSKFDYLYNKGKGLRMNVKK